MNNWERMAVVLEMVACGMVISFVAFLGAVAVVKFF